MERFLKESSDEEDEPGMPKRSDLTDSKGHVKAWDKAECSPPDEETQAVEDEACYVFFLKFMKILAYILTFLLTIGGTVASKSLFLLMSAQLNPRRTISFCKLNKANLEVDSVPFQRIVWSWSLFFCYAFPESLIFFRAIRIWMFKVTQRPTFKQFFIPAVFETCHVFGLGLLTFAILPYMTAVKGAMLSNTLCSLPLILSLLSRIQAVDSTSPTSRADEKYLRIFSFADALCLLFVLVGLILWPIFNYESNGQVWLLPISCILVSFGWWENFADGNSNFYLVRYLGTINLGLTRYTTYIFLPFWKVLIFGLTMILATWIRGDNIFDLFENFQTAFYEHQIQYYEPLVEPPIVTCKRISPRAVLLVISAPKVRQPIINGTLPSISEEQLYGQSAFTTSYFMTVPYVIIAQCISALITYSSAKFACKIGVQSFGFAFPLCLGVPATIVMLVSICWSREDNTCFWKAVLPPYLFWECPKGDLFNDFFISEFGWMWFLWILAQIWVTLYIWSPKFKRLERSDILFTSPMYNGFLVDQSLALNRRKKEIPIYTTLDEELQDEDVVIAAGQSYRELRGHEEKVFEEDSIPKIFACATMWHETKSEMKEILKSVFRMDEDQVARRIARKYFGVLDPDYYEIEAHIFFDDAFNKDGSMVNTYVKDAMNVLEEAASQIHETNIKLAPPKKYPTPYGGRLEWTLPGGTKFWLHLKNKNKIRPKKRWSQVMYMYYLLGHRLLELDIPAYRQDVIAENTFILALDGDVDFKPQAVRLLVDLMKKNKTLGAACGRIHPIGSGLMVWYQRFEYAIGHWFQKATEHIIGCVLCSPGCFSLFRGKALLEKNVMAKYTTRSTEARHYVQFDQGEDRWLCTLLLQQGYRVEYCAASDAYTHCPEQFGEFFTQRRRWVPSTMANILDLLVDSKRTIRTNPDISSPYIAYQMLMMVGSILGPGTIFLMLIGSFNTAFGISNFDSFLWNLAPVSIFIATCFFASSEIQLVTAQILSAVYALVMVAVLVALSMQIADDGFLAPISLFLFFVAASFVIAAILHPLEFGCLPFGLVYYLTIPSMYLLLIIYSLMNLNVVSWGTREVVPEALPDKAAEEHAKAQEQEKKEFGIWKYFLSKSKKSTGSFEISFAGLFKLMCCTKPVEDDKYQLTSIANSLADISKRLDSLERLPTGSVVGDSRYGGNIVHSSNSRNLDNFALSLGHVETPDDLLQEVMLESDIMNFIEPEKRNDLVNPEWIDDPDLEDGDVDFLSGAELTFWRELIDKYLLPIDKNPEKEKQITEELKDLRNKTIFFFFMVNACFVVAIFLLQNQKENIFLQWPLGSSYNMTYTGGGSTIIHLQENFLHLEPIGVVFVVVFAVILSIQFVAMLVHRFGTLSHILASTVIEWCSRDIDTVAKDTAFEKEGLNMIRRLQKLKTNEGDASSGKRRTTIGDVARRKTIQNMERQNNQFNHKPANIENKFNTTFKEASRLPEKHLKGGRDARVTFQQLERRRSTILEQRRMSTRGTDRHETFQSGYGIV